MDKKDIVLKSKKSNWIYISIIIVLSLVIGVLLIPRRDVEKREELPIKELSANLEQQSGRSSFDGRYRVVEPVDGVVAFPADSFDDKVQYFEYDGIRFFILKSNDGTIRAAFDACDVCFRSRRGYNQVGDYMQCNNCGQTFPEDKINVVLGGCNPSPLKREIVGQNLVINVADIQEGKRFF